MLHDKWFILSDKEAKRENSDSLTLKNGFILSYDKNLKVRVNEKRDIVVLGEAWQVDSEKGSVEDELFSLDTSDEDGLLKAEYTFCGRYAVIFGDKIYTDAVASMEIFYGGGVVSNSYPLICKELGVKCVKPKILHCFGMDYMPLPLTPVAEVKALMPSQVLDFAKRITHTRLLFPYDEPPFKSDEELAKVFVEYFVNSLKNMRKSVDGDIFVALTSGYDSRTVAALAQKAELDFKTYTLEHEGMSYTDYDLPPKLSKIMGREHIYLPLDKKNYSKKRSKQYIEHSGGFARDSDWQFYSYGLYDELVKRNGGKKILLLRGSIWECGYDYLTCHSGLFKNATDYKSFSVEEEMKELNDFYFNLKIDPLKTESLKTYLEYIIATPQENLSISNRFCTETYFGGWIAPIERGFDMMDNITSVQPCNSRLFLSLIHRFSTELSYTKQHEVLITKIACPEIASAPYDAPDEKKRPGKLRYMFDRFIRITKAYGFGTAIKYTYLSYKNK